MLCTLPLSSLLLIAVMVDAVGADLKSLFAVRWSKKKAIPIVTLARCMAQTASTVTYAQ